MDDEHPEWLPADWKVCVRVRAYGRKDKYYIDPQGIKFNSKPEVLRHLKKAENDVDLKKPNKTNFERTDAEKLPPGWMKEIKITKRGGKTRRDPYYVDPVSGHHFRSLQEVNHYLETKDSGKADSNKDDVNHPTDELKDDSKSPTFVSEEQRLIDSKEDKIFAGNEEGGAIENGSSLETNSIGQREGKDSVGEDKKQESTTPNNKRKKSNHKLMNGLPRRTSKRLARMEVDSPSELETSNGAREAARPEVNAIGNTGKSEINTCADFGMQKKTVEERGAREAAKPVNETEISTSVISASGKSEIYISGDFGKHKEANNVPVGDISSSEEHEGGGIELKEGDKERDLNVPLNELLRDPCIEFAIKMLNGEIPIEDANKFSVASPNQTSGSSSAPPPSVDIWADPCFEFAVKTLTSEIPTDAFSPLSSSGCNSK